VTVDFAHPGKPNLYSTEEHGHLVPATLLPASRLAKQSRKSE
jgi:hypothetical protein